MAGDFKVGDIVEVVDAGRYSLSWVAAIKTVHAVGNDYITVCAHDSAHPFDDQWCYDEIKDSYRVVPKSKNFWDE